MTRLTDEEKNELVSSGRALSQSMTELKGDRELFRSRDGTIDVAAIVSFLNQINDMIGHRRKPFCPILGEHFLL